MAGYKTDRVSEDIKREIAAMIRELKDPRIQGMLTVVNVEVSSDASFAKVYVSAMEGIETAKTAVKGLTSATGYIRREIGKRLHLRKTPELKFIADDSIEKGMNITRLINSVVKEENPDEDNPS
jgi:ribosome-binding factor A